MQMLLPTNYIFPVLLSLDSVLNLDATKKNVLKHNRLATSYIQHLEVLPGLSTLQACGCFRIVSPRFMPMRSCPADLFGT